MAGQRRAKPVLAGVAGMRPTPVARAPQAAVAPQLPSAALVALLPGWEVLEEEGAPLMAAKAAPLWCFPVGVPAALAE